MSPDHFQNTKQGRSVFFLLLCLSFATGAFTQKSKADSLTRLLASETKDTNRARLLWQLAGVIDIYDPNRALLLSQQALYLSREAKYVEGQSKSLGALANTFAKTGNYPRAIELYLEKLKLEEKRNTPRNLSSVLMNLGIVYVLQEDYNKALDYYSQADSVIREYDVEDMKYYSLLNLGDVYNRLNRSDSAYHYFLQSLQLAEKLDDIDLLGASMTGLGHSYLKMGDYQKAAFNYRKAIDYLQAANDDDILCEATLGMANLYKQMKEPDSARQYGSLSLAIAKRSGFLSHQLEAAQFLTNHYREARNVDSAFAYINQVLRFNDSINSKSRIRESQMLSTNEQMRQLEIKEDRRTAAKERFKQLQLLFIGIFIPGFFLFTLTLSRIKINIRIIKILGVLSMLILFEYLTLLLHPHVEEITHHTPIYEMLIFVALAAILIPAHHRLEHWLVEKLVRNRTLQHDLTLRLKPVKLMENNEPAGIPPPPESEPDTGALT